MRPSGRAADVLRPISLTPGFARHAEGSCLIRMGDTEVLCAASVEGRVPPFLRNSGQGWVTAEYGMLPRATHTRGEREAARGKQSGRTQEIQRLIGRALRAVVDRSADGRDHRHARLRRAERRWRHPLRRDHRRLGGAEPRLSPHAADERDQDAAADRPGGRGLLRHLPAASRCWTSTMRRIRRPMRTPTSC